MKSWRKVMFAVVATGAIGGGGVMAFQAHGASTTKASALHPVETIGRRNLNIAAQSAGLVEPVNVVEVKSKASGEVLRVLADTGDRVEAGSLLAEIDPRDVQSALKQAQADLQSAQVKASVTEAHRARMKQLLASQTVTQEEYESAMDAASAAKADSVRAQAALTLAQERSKDVVIRAPSAGTILSRSVQPGGIIASATSNVSGGTTLFTMADLSRMQVRAKVSEADIGQVAPGQTAKVTVQAYPGRTFTGKVVKVEPQAVVEQNVTLFPVLIQVDNQEGLLKPGMNAEVSVQIVERRNVVAVPSAAVVAPKDAVSTGLALGLDAQTVRQELGANRGTGGSGAAGAEGGPAVLFLEKGQTVTTVAVSLGLSDWEYTEVKQGLSGGEQVVLVAAAKQAQAQQQQNDKLKSRMSGPIPGAGAASGGGRGGSPGSSR